MFIGPARVHLLLGIPEIGAFLTTTVEELGSRQSTKGCSILHVMLAVSGTHVSVHACVLGVGSVLLSSILYTIGVKFHSFWKHFIIMRDSKHLWNDN